MFKIIVIGSKMSTRYNNKFGVCCVFCFPLLFPIWINTTCSLHSSVALDKNILPKEDWNMFSEFSEFPVRADSSCHVVLYMKLLWCRYKLSKTAQREELPFVPIMFQTNLTYAVKKLYKVVKIIERFVFHINHRKFKTTTRQWWDNLHIQLQI